ncbi:MAG: 2-oxoacid:acceptor oxidoreductase subunit alpha [Candidatus Omnitrophica bacterium]|nr:2-oxoacid:acceptor oxidoreductase subunit alpha [Candidatus Omnitrophota bacterium]
MQDMVFLLGGEGGEGVISTGELLTLALARSGYEIYTFRTYPAEIKGGHANYQVRASKELLLSQGDHPDVLLAFNEEAYDLHAKHVRHGGVIVYDSDSFQPKGNPDSSIAYAIPLTTIAIEQIGMKLSKNMVGLGVLAGLFNLPVEKIEDVVRERFIGKGAEVADKNAAAVRAGFGYATTKLQKTDPYRLEPAVRKQPELVLSGNTAFALGALASGLKIYAGYPITPATDIMEWLAEELPKVGGAVMQTEDEISAIGVVLGASFAGKKAMTASSGPGFSLMAEMLGLATMAEIPAVIVDVQRVGPSTGMPTKTEQGDLYLACYGGHGSSPRIVMALTSVEDCFYGAMRAFDLAEQFQMPVIVLSDQYLGHRKATVLPPDPTKIKVINRRQPTGDQLKEYKRYRFTKDAVSPMAVPGTPGGFYIATGLEHDETGYPRASDTQNHFDMTQKRYQKFEAAEAIADEIAKQYGDEHPEIGILGWGSTEGVIREAVEIAKKKGYSVGALHPKILYPLPLKRIHEFIKGTKALIVPEVNYTGQWATLLSKRIHTELHQLNKCIGLPFSPGEIVAKIEEVARGISHRTVAARV